MIRFLLLVFIILFPIVMLVQFIYYKFTKMGQAKWNKMKYDEDEFIKKWGNK